MSKKLQFCDVNLCRKILFYRLTNKGECRKITKVAKRRAQIAQLVEQRTENPRVAGSIPALGITRKGFIYMRV